MAASGFTPISLYYSTTASAVPTSGNLANGELGLNIADMKLYAKNSAGTVTLLASNAGASGSVTSVSGTGTVNGLTLTGTVTTSGSLTLGGTLSLVSPPPIGSTTPNTGAFTTLSASGAVTLTNNSVNQLLLTGSGTAATRIQVLRGTDDPTQSTQYGWNGQVTERSGGALISQVQGYNFVFRGTTDATPLALTYNTVAVTGALSATGNLTSLTAQFGTNPAGVSIGVIGIPNQKRIYGRNAANNADVPILFVDGNNNVVFGPNDNATFTSTSLGIGTNSPAYAVDIRASASNSLLVGSSANAFGSLLEWNNASGFGRVGTLGGYPFDLATNGSTRFRIGDAGQFGIGGATYGTAGQVLTSGGSGAAPTWAAAGGGSQAFVAFGSTGGL